MHSLLKSIIQHKSQEVENLKSAAATLHSRTKTKSLKQALRKDKLSFIAEIKRKSPSKGQLAAVVNPCSLASMYHKGGIDALSILTDQTFFGGSLSDLRQVAKALAQTDTPILRKDFIIDCTQIIESVQSGADAILLIVSVLRDNTSTLLQFAKV